MSQFNLIDEKWIPVRFLDGTRDELGISDVLLKSKEIEAIENSSPLVVAALHRFLLAVLYRALGGPTDIDQAKDLFRDGLPSDKISAYLEEWWGRFYLFDERHPFGQVSSVPDSEIEPWTNLAAEHNATTKRVLFDHTDTREIESISLNVIARWLIATFNFSVRGGRGYSPSPSAGSIVCIPLGNNLQETLLISLVPYPNKMVMEGDLPVWEREPNIYTYYKSGHERSATGFADIYTWRARVMRLIPMDGEISKVAFMPGLRYVNSELRDPMTPYHVTKKGGIEPVDWEDRGLWRSFDSLLPDASSPDGLEPRVMSHLAALSRARLVGTSLPLLIIGQKFKNAAIEFWRMERFKLPIEIEGDPSVKVYISQLLAISEEAGNILDNSLRKLGKSIITKGDRELMPDKWAAGSLRPGDVTKYVMSTNVLQNYWSTLETHFHNVLREYSFKRDDDDIRNLWLVAVRDALKLAWEQHSASVSTGDAWAIRALVKAEGRVLRKLKELGSEISQLEPQEVSA